MKIARGDPREPEALRGGFLACVGLIAVAGVAIRMLNVRLAHWNVPTGSDDAGYYYLQADLITMGRWFIDPFLFVFSYGHTVKPSAAHPPLFTLLLAVAREAHLSTFNATRLFCAALGGVGVFVVGLLGHEVAGRRAGLLATGIAAIYPVWWMTDGLILSEVVYVPIVAGLLLLAYRIQRRPRMRTAVALGAVGGLAALTRSEGLLLLIMVAGAVLVFGRNPNLTTGRRWQLLGVTVLAALVVTGPWTGFNAARFQHPVYMSTNAGATLIDTNCPQTYSGAHIGGWVLACHTEKVTVKGDESDGAIKGVSAGLRYARSHAGRVPVVVLARVGRVWGVFRPVQTIEFDAFGKWSHDDSVAMAISYGAVALAALAGLAALRRRHVTIVPFVAAIVAVTLTGAAFYGIIRFRVPGDVAFVALAAVALDALIARAVLT
jgi:MYXO-CTERM domain-containing protein